MFTGEVDCTYFFAWDTKHACVKEKEDLLCSVTDGKRRYDLSALARHSGGLSCWRSSVTCSRGRPVASFVPRECVWKCCYCFLPSHGMVRMTRNNTVPGGRTSELEVGITVFCLGYWGLI